MHKRSAACIGGVLAVVVWLIACGAGYADTIAPGETKSGNLASAGQSDSYSFVADAGDTVTILMGTTRLLYLNLELQAPDGSVVKSVHGGSYCSVMIDAQKLTQAGTYLIVCRDYYGTHTGTYGLSLIKNPGSPTSAQDPDGGPIQSGETKTGTIGVGDLDACTFVANAGDSVTILMAGSNIGPCLELQAPDGSVVATAGTTSSPAIIDAQKVPQSGTYYIICRDYYGNGVGAYGVSLIKNPGSPTSTQDADGGPIQSGETRTGTLGVGDLDACTFVASAGDSATILMATTNYLYPCLELEAPDGSVVTTVHGGSYSSVTIDAQNLTQDGTYYVICRDYYGRYAGTYTITARYGEIACPRLTIGEPQTIVVSPAMPACYEVEVPVGAPSLFLTLQKDSAWYGELKLYSGGNVVAQASGSTDFILQLPTPAAGVYQINVSGSGSAVLAAWTSLPELTLGEWRVGTILRQWGSAWYQINVPPGQSLLSIAVETIGIYSQLKVFYGQVAGSPNWSATGDRASLQVPSPASGMYYVQLSDSAWIQGDSQARDHMIKADVVPIPPPPAPAPTITSITPTTGGTAGPVTVTIKGQSLDAGATVSLRRDGYADVVATSVSGSGDGRTLGATFDLSSAAAGEWTLVVTNPDTQSATAPLPFVVASGGDAKLWVEVVGRAQMRYARYTTFVINYGNRGDTDFYDGVLVMKFPAGIAYMVQGDGAPDAQDLPLACQQDGDTIIPVWLIRVPAGYTGQITLKLSVPQTPEFPLGRKIPVYADVRRAPSSLFSSTGGPDNIGYSPIFRAIEAWAAPYLANAGSDNEFGQAMQRVIGRFFVRAAGGAVIGYAIAIASSACFEAGHPEWGAVLLLAGVALSADLRNAVEDLIRETMSLLSSTITGSISPEDKYGPSGYDVPGTPAAGLKRWVPADRPLDYRVDFWNKEGAGAATQDVIVTDQLDPNLDRSSFKFTEFGFLDWRVQLEPCQYFNIDVQNVQIDLSKYYPGAPVINLVVNVEGTFDPETGQIEWQFHALDPITRQPPENPLAGFLPPITDTGWEVGWVGFSASPPAGVATGTVIGNQAYVKFDVDVFKPAPPAGPFTNTVDSVAPTSGVLALPTESPYGFQVCWSGTDDAGGSGVHDYSIYVSDNGGPYTAWLTNTTQTCAMFEGIGGHAYSFYSVARDNVGNVEGVHAAPDAATTVVTAPVAEAGPDKTIDQGGSAVLEGSASGGVAPYTYAWTPTAGLSDANVAAPIAPPPTPTTYVLTVTDALAQTDSDSVTVHVLGVTPLFTDMPADDPARGVIEAMANAGITAGCGGGAFCPLGTVTRGQMAVFLDRAAGVAPINNYPNPNRFADVPSGADGIVTGAIDPATVCDADGTHQFYQYVEAFADPASWPPPKTVPTAGCDTAPPRFCPQKAVTRAQMACFLCRACGKTLLNPAMPTFQDVPTDHQFYQFIETLADPGSWTVPPTTGCQVTPTRLFCPEQNCLRSEMAWFIVRAFDIPY